VADSVWRGLTFPPAPPERPWIFINMVTTIDGKILTGERDDDVHDLGSPIDHATMKVIEAAADGIIIGAGTLRATPVMNFPATLKRYAVSTKGKVDPSHSFFIGGPSWLVLPGEASGHPVLSSIKAGARELDFREALRIIRQDHGVERLLCEGGAELNGVLLGLDVVDELFWTVAPKIKLGRDVPTYADGEPLPRSEVTKWTLVQQAAAGNELFLRYRRDR
jgi:2,5-diamino-6-(ribosylamino)-4(3H)-pyrimidinone 5'-phosphate reductase